MENTYKLGKIFLYIEDVDKKDEILCFNKGKEIGIRIKDKKKKGMGRKLDKNKLIFVITEIVNSTEFMNLPYKNNETVSTYVSKINLQGDEYQRFISQIDILLKNDAVFIENIINIDFFILKILFDRYYKKERIIRERYFKFINKIGGFPKGSVRKSDWRDGVVKNKTYESNQLIKTINVSECCILYIYQGSFSTYDMLIRYRTYKNGKWSRERTPKHIHWVVDILLKQQVKKRTANKFLDDLIKHWKETKPIKNNEDRDKLIKRYIKLAFEEDSNQKFSKLNNIGDYDITFLLLVAMLLIAQEKTNNSNAYMFKNILDALKCREDIFDIISIATHR